MATAIKATAFLSLLRGAGVLTIPNRLITWVHGLSESCTLQLLTPRCLAPSSSSRRGNPPSHRRRGSLFARGLPPACSRLTCVGAVPMPRATPSFSLRGAFLNYLAVVRSGNPTPLTVSLAQASLATLIRQALVQVCRLSAQQSARFTVHSLRVGGINYYKRIGVSIGIRDQIASHKSLVTSRKYLSLLPVEQLVELSIMADPS